MPAVHFGRLNIQAPEDALPTGPNIQSPAAPPVKSNSQSMVRRSHKPSDLQAEPARSETLNVKPIWPGGAPLNIQTGNKADKSNIQSEPGRLYKIDAYWPKPNIQESPYSKKFWKRSLRRPGHLIKRIKGYYIVESPYGASYGKSVGRDPKTGKPKLSFNSKLYEHAGHVKWSALEASGRLVKEIMHGRSDTIPRNGRPDTVSRNGAVSARNVR